MSNPVVHFEVIGKDPAALRAFYGEVFGWEIHADNPMGYGMVHTGTEHGIGGGIGGTDGSAPTGITFYVEVDDLQAALDAVAAKGGSVVMPPTDVPDGPSIAQFLDPEGNRIGLTKGM